MTSQRRTILLVDDDPSDALLMREAMRSGKSRAGLAVAGDGDEALAYLRGEGAFSSAPRADLVLLDWRMPKKNGAETLREIRGDTRIKLVPVVVLTTSSSEQDVEDAYALGANAYVSKPTGLSELERLVARLEDFWLECATLPCRASSFK